MALSSNNMLVRLSLSLLLTQTCMTNALLTPSKVVPAALRPKLSVSGRLRALSTDLDVEVNAVGESPNVQFWMTPNGSNGKIENEGGEKKLTSGYVASLQKILTQQQAEVRETKRLLKILEAASHGVNITTDEFSVLSTSLASSILSGFDYGFVSRSAGVPSQLKPGLRVDGLEYGGPPGNILELGSRQFVRNWNAILGEYRDEEDCSLTPEQEAARAKLHKLTLNSTEIWAREFADGPIQAPWIIKAPYLLVCYFLDVVFEGRYVPSRFFLLETVARMPYFSYITMLHLYETLGFWRRSADMKRIHFAEEINEYRHLLIMESLGGDQSWWVRFVAQHAAIVYYVILCVLWAVSPSLSYKFSELLESHAVNTYSVFLDNNEELLKKLPPSLAAVEYYSFGMSDPMYAEFQTSALSKNVESRKPGLNMRSLYDVFSAIRDDECDHVSTMQACLDPQVSVRSPSLEKKILTGMALLAAASVFITSGIGEVNTVVENADVLADIAATDVPLDAVGAAIAGAAGVGKEFLEDEEGLKVAGAAAEGLKRFVTELLEILLRIIIIP